MGLRNHDLGLLLEELPQEAPEQSGAGAGAKGIALLLRLNNFSSGKRRPWHHLAGGPVTELDVSDCMMGATGVTDLVSAIRASDTVRVLRLSRNVLARGARGAKQRLARALGDLASGNSVLRELEIRGDAGSKRGSGAYALHGALLPLLEELQNNTSLTKLDITGNAIGNNGALFLAKTLGVNTALSDLAFDCNGTQLAGLHALASAMAKNYNVHTLEIPSADAERQAARSKVKAAEALLFLERLQELLVRNQEALGRQAGGMHVTSPKQLAHVRALSAGIRVGDMQFGGGGSDDEDRVPGVGKLDQTFLDDDDGFVVSDDEPSEAGDTEEDEEDDDDEDDEDDEEGDGATTLMGTITPWKKKKKVEPRTVADAE
eukprot:g3826.t1